MQKYPIAMRLNHVIAEFVHVISEKRICFDDFMSRQTTPFFFTIILAKIILSIYVDDIWKKKTCFLVFIKFL